MRISIRIFIQIIILFSLASCCRPGQNETESTTSCSPGKTNISSRGDSQDSLKLQLGLFLDKWHSAASRADMQAYFDMIDEEGVYIGTDATERWTKQAFYDWSKPYFDKGKAWSFQAEERNIYLSEDQKIAWFDEKLTAVSGPLRGSGVIMNRNGQWKIMHYVISVTVPNEKFSEIMKLIGEE